MDPQPGIPTDGLRPLRPLLPAAAPSRETRPSPPKRIRISLACSACRYRKTKCCGSRPQCQECIIRVSDCQYTSTETALLKRKHEDHETLFEMLKTLPEEEAKELFAMIRAGGEVGEIVEQAKGGSLLVQLSLTTRRKEDRRVSITGMLNT